MLQEDAKDILKTLNRLVTTTIGYLAGWKDGKYIERKTQAINTVNGYLVESFTDCKNDITCDFPVLQKTSF